MNARHFFKHLATLIALVIPLLAVPARPGRRGRRALFPGQHHHGHF